MEQHDFFLLGTLESSKIDMAEQRIYGRFPNEEKTYDMSAVMPSLLLREDGNNDLFHTIIELIATQQQDIHRAIEAVLKGRVCMDYLISTDGGRVERYGVIKSIFELCKVNGGTVKTYACDAAQSLGAMVWALGDERYALKHSRLMWHLPQTIDSADLAEVQAEWGPLMREETARFFNQNPSGVPYVSKIESLQGNDELVLTADELHAVGLVNKVFPYSQDIKAHIASRTPWKFTQEDNDTMLGGQLWYELSQPTR